MTLCGCTTLQPVVQIPQLPPAPAPAECTKAAFAAFAPELTGLSTDYTTLDPKARARVLATNKRLDGQQHRLLRSQALRCAR